MLLVAPSTQAISLRLLPPSQNIDLGTTATVSVEISDLGHFAAPSLSGFGLEATFDSNIITFQSLQFGDPILGDLLNPIAFQSITNANTNLVIFSEISAADAAILNNNQPSSFIIARLNFQGMTPGTSPLNLAISLDGLLDENLDFLNVSTIEQASITVNNPTNIIIPEPPNNPWSLWGFLILVIMYKLLPVE
jgi:hypothetical protein